MELIDLFMVSTTALGFIFVLKNLFNFVKWVWRMFFRAPKNLRDYGSWAIITGSTDGIGKAMALELASKGLNLLLLGRNPTKLEATSNEIREKNNKVSVEVKCLVVDFEKENGERIKERVEEAIEGLDVGILVNSAGLAYRYARFFHEVDSNLINSIIKVNVEGTTWITKAVIQKMVDKKKGAIINMGSGSTVVLPSYPLVTLYAATKAYLAMLSRSISLEYKQQGIDIQCQVLSHLLIFTLLFPFKFYVCLMDLGTESEPFFLILGSHGCYSQNDLLCVVLNFRKAATLIFKFFKITKQQPTRLVKAHLSV
ncbi:Very-long-chain 3-oxoacyl-CoA reductase [Arachis hypogaea]|nr:Very-long-chain 3-oxoacyl-CoA reductase [Arachis hypogaea]